MGRLSDLTKNLSNMSEQDLMAHVQNIRHNKYIAKPAVKKRQADVEKAEKNTQVRGANKAIAKMSEAEKLALLKLLEGEGGEG